MSNYTQITAFTPKDTLVHGDPAKVVRGSEFDAEFAAIATAIASKYDSTNISSNPVQFGAGAPSAPSIFFGTFMGTGFYSSGADQIGISAAGVNVATLTATSATFQQAVMLANDLTVTGNASFTAAVRPASIQVGGNSGPNIGGGFAPLNGVEGLGGFGTFYVLRWSSGNPGTLIAGMSPSGTIGTFSALGASVTYGRLIFASDSGAMWNQGAAILAQSSSAWSTTNAGTDLKFQTVTNGSLTPTTVLTLGHDGVLVFTNTVQGPTVNATTDIQINSVSISQVPLPHTSKSANYTLTAADAGSAISVTASVSITVPTGLPAGSVYVITAGSGNIVTIVQGSGMTLQWAVGSSTAGNRTLTGYGVATILIGPNTSTNAFISGGGLS